MTRTVHLKTADTKTRCRLQRLHWAKSAPMNRSKASI